ncbi:hypothetical protein TUM12370_11830 [Salmonella enterica subsp. enterica serovar Choleraesuis]|nr:hypothetical protein TUM12370_11830 [Salmonella enterica subsp. enterica serovar Choleraesuis]
MLGFVLFLVAVLLIIIIARLLPRKAYKWIGLSILIVAGLFAAIVGYFLYQDHQSTQRWQARQASEGQEMVTFLHDVDDWGIANAKKTADGYSINRDKIREYANDLYQARHYSFFYSPSSYSPDSQRVSTINTTLGAPLDGISEVKIVCDFRFLDSDCLNAVKQGYRGGFLLKIYSLDKQKVYSPSHGWKNVSSSD